MIESDRIDTYLDELESSTQPTTQEPNEHIGNILEETPNQDTTRIYFQNLNGLSWTQDGGRWPYICDAMDCIQADIACFCETNTDTNQYKIRTAMEAICQKTFSQSRLIMSASKYKTTTAYKPGGTALLACNSITATIKSHSRDRMGRWTSITLQTKSDSNIRIIVAYQVCENANPGSGTASAQQRAQIIEESGQNDEGSSRRHTPRQAFITELQSFIQQSQSLNEQIIVIGDFNEEIDSQNSGIGQLAQNCELADLMSIRLGSPKVPATYQRGPRRLDYVLVTPTLVPHVQAAGYDPFGYRIPSDHRGLFIDFSSDALFQHEISPLSPMEYRDFRATSPQTVVKYVSKKMQYLLDHQFYERLQLLKQSTLANHELAEALDRDFQRAARHAAKQCARKPQPAWSPKLAKAWATLHFFKLAKSAKNNPVNYNPALERLRKTWPDLPQTIPTNDEEIHQGYTLAIANLKKTRREAQAIRDEYLQQKASLYASLDQAGKARIVKRLIKAETQHRIYKKIRYLRNIDNGFLGLCRLKIPKAESIFETETIRRLPDTPDHWETVTVPTQIEQLLIQRNRHKDDAQPIWV